VNASVTDLLRDHPVIDGHNDLLWALRHRHNYDFDAVDIGERQDGLASGVARRLERQLTGDARHRRNAHASLRRALGAHRVANDAERVAEDVEADAHVADGRRRESRCRGARHRPAG